MKITKQLRSLGEKELQERLQEFKKELMKMNTQVAMGAGGVASGKIRQTKKNIARIYTVMGQKEESLK